MRSRSQRIASLIAILLVSILMVACEAGSAGAPEGPELVGRVPEGEAADRDESAGGGDAGSDGGAPEPASPIEQRIIKTGEISIEVGDVMDGVRAVRALATEMGGYVGASQASHSGAGATLTLRIPADRFDATIERLEELGEEVLGLTTRDEDVTGAIVDLEARLTNLRASEQTYRNLLSRAERIDDILAVQAQLDEVRGQIEQLEAEAAYLEEQADLSTLTVSLRPTPVERTTEEWNPGAAVDGAIAALVALGQGILVALIWIGIVVLPILLLIGAITFVALRIVEIFRRRQPGDRPA